MLYEIVVLILLLLKLTNIFNIGWFVVFSPIAIKLIFFVIDIILTKIKLKILGIK